VTVTRVLGGQEKNGQSVTGHTPIAALERCRALPDVIAGIRFLDGIKSTIQPEKSAA
jgi:hypothetical protein